MTNLIMKIKTASVALAVAATLLSSSFAQAQADRNISVYNLKDGMGLKGFDPVSIFPEGGGASKAGVPSLRLNHEGVTYLFSTQKNLDLFRQSPDKYEPTYGGWCAFAMAFGEYVDIQPDLYTLRGNRAHYFAHARAKRNFDANPAKLEADADQHWKRLSGEAPRN